MEQVLVSGVDAFFQCPVDGFLSCYVRWSEAVVVETEDRADKSLFGLAGDRGVFPGHELVLWSDNAVLLRCYDASHVLALALEVHFLFLGME